MPRKSLKSSPGNWPNTKRQFVAKRCFKSHQRRSRQQSTPSSIGSGVACFPVAPGTDGQQKEENSMYTMNQITIIGFTGSDAEAHYTQNGTLVVTLSVATKESWKDADG